jgi:hypothetical protein
MQPTWCHSRHNSSSPSEVESATCTSRVLQVKSVIGIEFVYLQLSFHEITEVVTVRVSSYASNEDDIDVDIDVDNVKTVDDTIRGVFDAPLPINWF